MSTSPRTRPSSGSIIAGIFGIAVLVVLVGLIVLNGQQFVRSFFPPTPVSSQGRAIDTLYTIVFAIAAIIFFLVEGLIVWSVIRYRRKPGDDELPPQTHGHNLAEIIWTVVPTIIVIFLFFISWQTLNTVEATTPQPDLASGRPPASSSGRSTTSRRTARRSCSHRARQRARVAGCTCRPARRRICTSMSTRRTS